MAWNGSDGRSKASPPTAARRTASRSTLRWLLAGVVALTIAGGALLYFIVGGDAPSAAEATGAMDSEKRTPRSPQPAPRPPRLAPTNAVRAAATNASVKTPEPPPFKKRPGAMQLPDGRVLTFKPPKEGEFKIVHSHGAVYKCDHLGNWEDVTPKPVFDNAFEESLVGLATSGIFIPGVLMGLDYDYVIKMLTKPVVVDPGDPEDVVAKKEAVAAAKEAILDYMKDGASFDDFVMDMRRQVATERAIRGMALKEIVGLLKAGRTEEAADMRDAAERLMERETGGRLTLPAHIASSLEGR